MSESDPKLEKDTVREIIQTIEAIRDGEVSASECMEIRAVLLKIRRRKAVHG